MALGGISLEQTLRAETEANTGRSHKAIINICIRPAIEPGANRVTADFWESHMLLLI